MHTVNVDFLVSERTEEQYSDITSSKINPWNDSEICHPMVPVFNALYFGFYIFQGGLELFNPYRYIISLSVTDSIGVLRF